MMTMEKVMNEDMVDTEVKVKKEEFDGFFRGFGDELSFLNFLNEWELNTSRHEIPPTYLKFSSINKYCESYGKDQLVTVLKDVNEEVVDDTQENTDLIVFVGGEPYLVGSSAWISMKGRIDIYGKGLDRIGSELQAEVLNKRFLQLKKPVKAIIANKKVRAIMSSLYKVVPAQDLFNNVLERSVERFGDFEFVNGYADHYTVRCKILFPGLEKDINNAYNLPHHYTPGLVIITSDTGYSSHKIGAFWKTNIGSFINSSEYLEFKHMGGNTLDKIADELPNLFLKYQNVVRKFADMMDIEIDMPVNVLKKAYKHLKIPKKYINQSVSSFETYVASVSSPITAYDICRKIMQITTLADTDTKKTALEEKVGKAINLNYAKLDNDDDEIINM